MMKEVREYFINKNQPKVAEDTKYVHQLATIWLREKKLKENKDKKSADDNNPWLQ